MGFKLPRRWSVDSAIAKLQDEKERHRLDAAIWVWSRDAGHFSDEELIRLIEVLEAAGLDAYIEAPSAPVPEAGKRARVLRPLLQRLLGEPLAR